MPVGPKVTNADVWDLKRTNQFSAEWQWLEGRLAEKHAEPTSVGADDEPSPGEPDHTSPPDDSERSQ